MSLSIDEVKALAKKVTTSSERAHYNGIVKLLAEFPAQPLPDVDEHGDSDREQHLRFLAVALFQVFKKLFARGELAPLSAKKQQAAGPAVVKFNQWCRKLYASFKTKLLAVLALYTQETSLALDCLDLYMQLLEQESVHFASRKDAPFFPNKTLAALIAALWQSRMDGDASQEVDQASGESANFLLLEFRDKYYKPFVDVQYYTQAELAELVVAGTVRTDDADGIAAAKWVALTNHDNHIDSPDAELEVFVSNPPQAIENESKFKGLLERNWCTFLNGTISPQLYKTILTALHKRIIPHFHTPTKLMDFLTDSYNQGGIVAILALNGLFELMVKNNLEYPNFYPKLYQLITPELMHVKYRPRFFRLMDIFLASTHLSVHLVASFIKRLARLSLSAPPSAIVIVIPFIYNMLKKHPNCMIMIHNPKYISDPFQTPEQQAQLKAARASYADPFNMDEADPENTGAFGSSLWEMDSLMQHYHPNVASLAKVFSQPFKKMSYNMEDFLDWGYDSLLAAEASRRLKVLPVLEYETFDQVVADTPENKTSDDSEDAAGRAVYLPNITW